MNPGVVLKAVVKSVAASLFATCLASFFLMMITVGTLGAMARMRSGSEYAAVDPSLVIRHYGLPLAALLFILFFALAMRRFRRVEERP